MLTLLCGPARCGKTERLLAHYRQELSAGGIGSVLWLAPTQRSAEQIRDKLLDSKLRACLSPGVMTFDQFARRVVEASPTTIRPLSRSQKRLLVRRLINQAAERGLTHFASIAGTSGLVDLVCEFITDLKRLEIWPEELLRACQSQGMQPKDRELHGIYAEYQNCLNAHRLYDREGCFWWARDRLAGGQTAPFGNLRLVVVDSFADFTRTQHEILQILGQRAAELMITLPLEPAPLRRDLFGKSLATIEKLRKLHPTTLVEEVPRPIENGWPALRHIEAELFKNPRQARPASDTARVEILACPRPWGEIRLVGQRIKRLLVEGDPELDAKCVRPGEIAVVFRSLTETAPLVREVFEELGLPFALESGLPLVEARPVIALLSLLRLDAEDWPFRSLLAVLGNNYFRPNWPEWKVPGARRSTERLIRRLQAPRGRVQLLAQLERLASLPDVDAEAPLDDAATERARRRAELRRDAQKAFPLLSRLSESLEQLPDTATPGSWADALIRLADDTGLLWVVKHDSTDRPAWDHLIDVLRGGEELTLKIEELPLQIGRAELPNWLHDALRGEQVAWDESDSGRIRVLSAASIRSLEVPYLFFAGLSEKSFPSPDREDRLYGEAESRRLRGSGLPLPLRADRGEEEMLLFYEVVTRATRRLYLSYPAIDDRGQPLLASPYLTDLERACGEGRILRQVSIDLSPIPKPDETYCAADCRTRGVASALAGEFRLLAGVRQNAGVAPAGQALLAGLEVTASRQRRVKFGPYEGLLQSPAVHKALTQKYGPEHCWSVSHLDQYAHCPHQFFLERVIGLEPLEELSLETDHGGRGRLLHETLAALHRRINDEPASAQQDHLNDEWLLVWYRESLEALLAADPADDAVRAALQEIDRRLLSDWGARYVEQHRDYAGGWEQFETPPAPAHFEVSFGLAPQSSDRLSTAEPLRLETPAGPVLFSGRIDRIDIGAIEGRPVFVIVDYKSGQSPSRKEVQDGRALQLPVYAIATEELLLARKAAPWQAGYWQLRSGGYRPHIEFGELTGDGSRASAEWQSLRQSVLNRVAELIRGIRSANFPMFSEDHECTSRCEYKTVCRVNQVRAMEKQWPQEE